MRRRIMKLAGHGATSLLDSKLNSKVYSNTITMQTVSVFLCIKNNLDRDMSMGFFFNPRVTATFSKDVVAGVMKNFFFKVLCRFYTNTAVNCDLIFSKK